MSTVSKLPNRQQRYDQASLWIAKLERTLTAQEELDFGVWMNAHPENQRLLLTMAEQWDKMDSLSRLSSMFPHHPADPAAQRETVGMFRRFTGWLGSQPRPLVALPLLAIIITAIVFARFDALETDTADDQYAYETAVGDQSAVLLLDGSYMRLNTDTLVQVAYSPEQRLLNLVRGELNIEVARDATRPLRVQANGRVVEAIGTAFNVEITEEQEVELVVTEGKVVVTLAQNATQGISGLPEAMSSDTPSQAIPTAPIAVSAGEEILLGSPDQELKKILPEETVVKLSWQQGNLVFRGESLQEAMAEVGRYTPVEFVFLDEKSKHVRIAGLFKAGDTENLLSALRENFNVTHEWVGSEKVLLSSL